MKPNIDLDIGRKTFASGLLPELIAVLRRSRPGDLIAIVGEEEGVGPELAPSIQFRRAQSVCRSASIDSWLDKFLGQPRFEPAHQHLRRSRSSPS